MILSKKAQEQASPWIPCFSGFMCKVHFLHVLWKLEVTQLWVQGMHARSETVLALWSHGMTAGGAECNYSSFKETPGWDSTGKGSELWGLAASPSSTDQPSLTVWDSVSVFLHRFYLSKEEENAVVPRQYCREKPCCPQSLFSVDSLISQLRTIAPLFFTGN